jgi:signal transduction histidine kinase
MPDTLETGLPLLAASTCTGEEFFVELAVELCRTVPARHVLVGVLDEREEPHVETLALASDGKLVENIAYRLRGSPCDRALHQAGAQPLHLWRNDFPDSPLLRHLNATSYLGIPLRDSDGPPLGILALLDDESIEPRAQIAQQLYRIVPRLVAEIQRHRREEDLQLELDGAHQTVHALETAVENSHHELQSFRHAISHDLRAPLRAIRGFSEALQRDHAGELDAEAHDYLSRIRNNAERMQALIDELLILSRVTSHRLQTSTVNLSEMADDILVGLRAGDPRRAASFSVQPGIRCEGDAKLLRVLLEKLLHNAWTYSRARTPAEIEFGEETRGEQRAYRVRDNGEGFSMEYAESIFETFRRLHRQDEYPGNGIGLATAKQIVDRHGGSIWAESEPGNGASFYFTLATRSAQ